MVEGRGFERMCSALEWHEEPQKFDREEDLSDENLELFRHRIEVQVAPEFFGSSLRGAS